MSRARTALFAAACAAEDQQRLIGRRGDRRELLGVDVGAKADIYRLLEGALDEGLAVVMVSTDFEEVASVAHRALVFVQGRMTEELAGDDLTVGKLTAASSGANLLTNE